MTLGFKMVLCTHIDFRKPNTIAEGELHIALELAEYGDLNSLIQRCRSEGRVGLTEAQVQLQLLCLGSYSEMVIALV